MRLLAVVVLDLLLRVSADLAFVAAPAQRVDAPYARSVPAPEGRTSFSSQASTTGAFLLGAALLAASRRRARTSRNVWTFYPVDKDQECTWPGLADDAEGPRWRKHVNLSRSTFKPYGRSVKYMKQQKILRSHNVWWAKYGAWHTEVKNPYSRNMYQGKPENPDFPSPTTGIPALSGWAPAALASSAPLGQTGSTFVGGKRAVFRPLSSRSALILHAHKKAAASTKNQGHSRNPHFWGVKALNGKAVKCRQLLVKQKGMNWYPGTNVMRCKNDSLISLRDGIVQWRGDYRHKEVSVVPWEYVNKKCYFHNPGNLAPKVYEPWMGSNFSRYSRKWPIRAMYEEWKETEEGQAHVAKKAEKKEKQKEIQLKIRAKKKWRLAEKKKEKAR
ncbi:unnamed protein product, partial [Effrenium voratum]